MRETLIIDNYDSFTYNLVQLVYECSGKDPVVIKNDQLRSLDFKRFEHIIISPGPGLPIQSGDLMWAVENLVNTHKILGICLGLQAIAEAYNHPLEQLGIVQHGIKEQIQIRENAPIIYKGIPEQFEVGRYHSWILSSTDLPEIFRIDCINQEGIIMGISHKELPVFGLQFHPESIMTPEGKTIMRNFLNL